MKLVLRAATALALLGLASPAFPCGEKKMTTASSTADAKGKAVAKSDKKAEAKTAKAPQQAAPVATN